MPQSSTRTPSYRLHKPSGQAVVTLCGQDFYLGPYGTPASRAEYDRLIAEWLANGRRLPAPEDGRGADLTVAELAADYLRWAEGYYLKDGNPTSEIGIIKAAIKPLRETYGHVPAKDFGPLSLQAVRDKLIEADKARSSVNRAVCVIRRIFAWGVKNERVPPSVHHGLKAVDGLRRGRSAAKEKEPVRPVSDEHLDAVEPYVSRQVWILIQIQRLTGARPGEVVQLRTSDIDRSGEVWVFTPLTHKCEHHGRSRTILLGPKAQAILRPWLREDDPTAPLFAPKQADAERKEKMREKRRSRVQPSQRDRSKPNGRRKPGDAYTTGTYRKAIAYAIAKLNRAREEQGMPAIPTWSPNQIRHTAATRIRHEYGLEFARAVLGHATVSTTEIYAEMDLGKAREAMSVLG